MFRKVCFVLFIFGLAVSVVMVLLGDRKAFIWVLVGSGLIQLMGRVR